MDTLDVAELAQTLFEEAGDALFLFDPESEKILDTNPMAQRLTGCSRQQLLRTAVTHLFRSDVQGGLSRLRTAFRETGLFHSQEGYFLRGHPEGQWLPVNLTITRLHAESGTLGLITARDMREQRETQIQLKKKEAELRRSEERFQAFMNNIPVLAFMLDEHGRLIYVNDAYRKLYGSAADKLLGTTAADKWPEDIARSVRETDLAVLSAGRPMEFQQRVPDGAGQLRDWWVLKFPFRDTDGRQLLGAIAADLSEQKRTQEALRASEAKYRCLVENLEQSIFLKNQELRFAAVNRNFCKVVGHSEQEILGKSDYELYPKELADKFRGDDLMVLAEGRVLQAEEQTLYEGQRRTVRVIKTPVKDAAGQNVGVLGIFWDITDQLAMETQLRHVQKMDAVGQLAGGVAHDFNNLLTVILGNLSLVLSKPEQLPGLPLEMLRNAEQAGLRAADLTQRLLGFSRRTMLRAEALDLNQAVEDTVGMLRRTIDPRIEIVLHLWPRLARIKADAGMVHQIVMNLALNARDAMPQGGTLLIETRVFQPDDAYLRRHVEARAGAFARLRVRDTGEGMTPEVRQRIFEPFFTTKEVGKGTGLGLAMIFGIVKQHHGWIVFDSAPHQGTTFDVFLPLFQGDPAAPVSTPAAYRGGDETILIVDDDLMIRNLASMILRRFGYDVVLAQDGLDALAKLRQPGLTIDLVILDGTMPRLSGRDTLREMIDVNPHIRVLFSSGYSNDYHDLSGFQQIVGFIQKPYRVDDLANKVRVLLDGARAS